MDNKFEEFLEAYRKASPELKAVVDSDKIGLFVDDLLKNTNYVNLKSKLMILTTNKFLGVIKDKDLVDALESLGVDEQTTQSMVVKIWSFIGTITVKNSDSQDITQDIAEAEAALQALEPIRTMTSDSHTPHQENTYTSTQSAILNEKIKKTEGDVDTPKWGNN
jgi:hypothetical protein